jgi:hypothetical protein
VSSLMIPTQPPCCHTLQTSHCRKKPAKSSVTSAGESTESSTPSLMPSFVSSSSCGGPGYSSRPQMQRTASSSSAPSSAPFADSTGGCWDLDDFSRSSARPRFRRVCIVSSTATASSSGSDDNEPEGVVFRGDSGLW